MKFSDIPKFTGESNYNVSIQIKYLDNTLNRYIKEGLNLNPDFQRIHVWSKKKSIAYVEYILKGGMSGRDIYFNCPGWMTTFEGDFVIVDGKQRLNALMLFLQNKINIFGYKLKEYVDKIPLMNYLDFHINNLKTRREVLTWYIEMNSGGVTHSKKELDKVRNLLEEENKRNK